MCKHFLYYLQHSVDRPGRSNNGPRAKRQQRPEEQRFNCKLKVILAREEIPGELENNSPSCCSLSSYFRDRSLNCNYAHG